jgi:DNA-binding transcriptional LysR family regulator
LARKSDLRFLTLRYFNEVAKLGSIRKAADRLHVAPSAVSRQIAQLELEVDAVLFERSKVGVQLTSAGEVLARHSHRVFKDLDRARAGIDDLRGLRRGEVSLWVIEGIVSDLLPDLLGRFHARYPGVRFRVTTGSSDRIVEALLEDEADIGITFNALPRAEVEVVGEFIEPIYCLVAASHEFAARKSLTLAEVCSQPLALSEQSFGLRQIFERAVTKRRLKANVIVTTNSLELTKTMAATGKALAFMPALTVIKELASGSLRAIPIAEPEFVVARSSVCIHRDRPLPHAAHEFLKMLTQELKGFSQAPRGAASPKARSTGK